MKITSHAINPDDATRTVCGKKLKGKFIHETDPTCWLCAIAMGMLRGDGRKAVSK